MTANLCVIKVVHRCDGILVVRVGVTCAFLGNLNSLVRSCGVNHALANFLLLLIVFEIMWIYRVVMAFVFDF